MESMYLDTTPCDEQCIPAGQPGGREEAERMIRGIKNYFSSMDLTKVKFIIRNNPHDFGYYHSIDLIYDENDENSCNIAYAIEGHIPHTWQELENETMA